LLQVEVALGNTRSDQQRDNLTYLYQVQLGIWSFPTGRTPGLDLDLVYNDRRCG